MVEKKYMETFVCEDCEKEMILKEQFKINTGKVVCPACAENYEEDCFKEG